MTGMIGALRSAVVRATRATETPATAVWPRPHVRFRGDNGSNRCYSNPPLSAPTIQRYLSKTRSLNQALWKTLAAFE